MPEVGAIYRYFKTLSVSCKLLKKSNLQFSLQESRKLFTVFSQNWMGEIHTASSNATTAFQTLSFARTLHAVTHAVMAGRYSTRVPHSRELEHLQSGTGKATLCPNIRCTGHRQNRRLVEP